MSEVKLTKVQRNMKEVVEKLKKKKGYQVSYKSGNVKLVSIDDPNHVFYLKSLKNYYYNVIELEPAKERPTKVQSATSLKNAFKALCRAL